jgi:hypothetical protein
MTTYTANVTVPESIDDSFAFIADPTKAYFEARR